MKKAKRKAYIIQMSTYWKSKIELKDYIQVRTPGGISCGGSQSWFACGDKDRRESVLSTNGCGLVALGDFLLMAGRKRKELYPSMENGCFRPGRPEAGTPLEQKRYLAYLRSLGKKYLQILPVIGANAWQMWAAAWRYRKKSGCPGRVRWGVFTWNLEKRIRTMLEQGLPVVFCIGPNMNPFRAGQKVPMYQMRDGGLKETAKVRGHYMNITGLCRDQSGVQYLQVSSWGKCFYIAWKDFLKYRSAQPPILGSWLSNILYWEL